MAVHYRWDAGKAGRQGESFSRGAQVVIVQVKRQKPLNAGAWGQIDDCRAS